MQIISFLTIICVSVIIYDINLGINYVCLEQQSLSYKHIEIYKFLYWLVYEILLNDVKEKLSLI